MVTITEIDETQENERQNSVADIEEFSKSVSNGKSVSKSIANAMYESDSFIAQTAGATLGQVTGTAILRRIAWHNCY